MTATFNLIHEPWIPVTDAQGTRTCGLLDALTSPSIGRIATSDPVTDAAILRLLIAITLRATEPISEPDPIQRWETIRDQGQPLVAEYLEQHTHEFDLFGPRPFMQDPDLERDGPKSATEPFFPIAGLIPDRRPEKPLHTTRGVPDTITPAEAARLLVRLHAADVAGVKSPAVGDPHVKAGKRYPDGVAPLGQFTCTWIDTGNLWDTVLVNMPPTRAAIGEDVPAWETAPPAPSKGLQPIPGPISMLTCQSRRVLLHTDAEGRVAGYFATYGQRADLNDGHTVETMAAFRKYKDDQPFQPFRLRKGTTAVRGLPALLQQSGTSTPPGVVRWAGELQEEGLFPEGLLNLRTVTIEYDTNKSIFLDVAADSIAVPPAAATDPDLQASIKFAVEHAETAVAAATVLAKDLQTAAGSHNTTGAATEARLYASLDPLFRRWVAHLDPADLDGADAAWRATVIAAANQIRDELIAGSTASWTQPRNGMTIARADHRYRTKINTLKDEEGAA